MGQSGRMLAQSAFKANIPTIVIDQFGDQDTQHYADECITLPKFSDKAILEAVERSWEKYKFPGLILSSGFENRIDLIKKLADQYPMSGNDFRTVSSVKDPVYLSDHLDQLEVNHPETRLSPPDHGKWLVKQRGACGGDHIVWWDEKKTYPATHYFQAFKQGKTCSVVFLAAVEKAEIIGINQIWTENETSFRFGGAVTFNDFPVYEALKKIVKKISCSLNLTGLCGLDFVLDESDQVHVLEINPRPVSTFDLHESKTGSLFLSHIEACDGQIHFTPKKDLNYFAKKIAYARKDLGPLERCWPDWVSDIPKMGDCIQQGNPVCTVYSEASSTDKALKLVHNRDKEL
ncbi:MAG: ATP-grasp domain-containing protein [Gammaproteobacteria bacterium]